jgi:hypothetical protein
MPLDFFMTRMGGFLERTTPNNGSKKALIKDYNQILSGLSQRVNRGEESKVNGK